MFCHFLARQRPPAPGKAVQYFSVQLPQRRFKPALAFAERQQVIQAFKGFLNVQGLIFLSRAGMFDIQASSRAMPVDSGAMKYRCSNSTAPQRPAVTA
jgi:hypothetical protein